MKIKINWAKVANTLNDIAHAFTSLINRKNERNGNQSK